MEADKKRKKNSLAANTADTEAVDALKKSKKSEEDAAGENEAVPTEDEVEEFFAILRRMKVAVNYFDRKGRSGGREWREVLEQAEFAVDDEAEDIDHRREANGAAVKKNSVVEGFDLNAAAPEAADAGSYDL